MLVSAISANNYQTSVNTNVNTKGNDNYVDKAFNSSPISSKKNTIEKDCKVFDEINKWKHFCHQQISEGNLDVIA